MRRDLSWSTFKPCFGVRSWTASKQPTPYAHRAFPDDLFNYMRRGKPAEHCRWEPDTILRYMRHRLASLKPGDAVGAKKAFLPASPRPGMPADLPQEVLDWETKSGKGPGSLGLTSTAAPSDSAKPEDKYKAQDKFALEKDTDGTEMLRHVSSGDLVNLDRLPADHFYRLYTSNTGVACVWAGGDAKPEYAFEIFVSVAVAEMEQEEKSTSEPLSSGTKVIAGMKGTEGPNCFDMFCYLGNNGDKNHTLIAGRAPHAGSGHWELCSKFCICCICEDKDSSATTPGSALRLCGGSSTLAHVMLNSPGTTPRPPTTMIRTTASQSRSRTARISLRRRGPDHMSCLRLYHSINMLPGRRFVGPRNSCEALRLLH